MFRKIWNFLIHIFHNNNSKDDHFDADNKADDNCEYDCKVLGFEDFEIEVENELDDK